MLEGKAPCSQEAAQHVNQLLPEEMTLERISEEFKVGWVEQGKNFPCLFKDVFKFNLLKLKKNISSTQKLNS